MTKLRANQIEIQEVLNDPAAQATEIINGTLRIATQAEVNAGSPYDNTIVVTPETLANFSGFDNWLTANIGDDFTIAPSTSAVNAIALGPNSTASGYASIAIGNTADAGNASTTAIGRNVTASGVSSVTIGYNVSTTGLYGTTVGQISSSTQIHQITLGSNVTATSVASDTAYSVKLGYGKTDANKNMLHLFSKGKLELYGSEAQFIFPNYEPAGSPATLPLPSTTIAGGTVYSADAKTLKFYNGTTWKALNADNWLHANNDTDFATAPIGTGSGSIALGNNASTSTVTDAIAIGTNVTAAINAVSIGPDSDALGTSSVAIGKSTQVSSAGTGIAIGLNANSGGSGSIAIGRDSSTISIQSIAFGYDSDTALQNQIAIGNACKSTSVTTDATYSVKLGEGATSVNKNMLHLFSKGKLELYGDEAQFILPNYQTGSPSLALPSTTIEGGIVYDVVVKAPKFYNGTAWTDISTPELGINSQPGITYILVLSDKDALVAMQNAATNELIIPTNASVAFPIGTQILVEQEGTGTTTITSAGSPPAVTIHSAGDFFDTASQHTTISLIKKATDTWLIVGDLV